MSESKKVIHVKDLVIKAENVHFEQPPRPERGRPFDAFFGVRRPDTESAVEQNEKEADIELSEEEQEQKEPNRENRPFSWL